MPSCGVCLAWKIGSATSSGSLEYSKLPLEVCTGWMPEWQDGMQDGRMVEWQDGRMAGRIWQDGTMALKRMALHLSFKMFMSSFSGYNLLSAMRAGGYYHYVLIHSRQIFFTKKLSNMMPEGSALAICHCRRVLCSRETRLLGLHSPSNVVSVYRRNSMWAVNY